MSPTGACRDRRIETRDARNHEMRAALWGIEAVAQCLNSQGHQITSSEQRELTSALAAEARRLRSMLDPSRCPTTSFDLAEAIHPVIVSARAAGLDVYASVPRGIEVEGRSNDAAQVVLALLDNARHHAASSAVDLRVSVRDGWTRLYVEDHGPGLASDCVGYLFERGVRGPKSTGSGLGLFVARCLMESQDGSLSASPRIGGGTSFELGFRSAPSARQQRVRSIPLRRSDPA